MGHATEVLPDLWTGMPIRFSPGDPIHIEDAVSFTWDFGDGSAVSTLAYPVHVFKDPDIYSVNLTVIHQDDQLSKSSCILVIKHDYGDTEVVLKAVGTRVWGTFLDPDPSSIVQAAVRRGGWVAYLCDIGSNQVIDVDITIIGDRPADIYLFHEDDFRTYRNDPHQLTVPFEEQGSEQNVTSSFRYSFVLPGPGRCFIVIDNRDRPLGTCTEGPVDYTISIESRPIEEEEGTDLLEILCDSVWLIIGLAAVPVAMVITLILLRDKGEAGDRNH